MPLGKANGSRAIQMKFKKLKSVLTIVTQVTLPNLLYVVPPSCSAGPFAAMTTDQS